MPKITVIEKSRKSVKCGRCGKTVPKGESYRFITPRYGAKTVRCMDYGCRFRPTDLSSAKTARVQEAIEDAEDQISTAVSHDDIQSILQDVASVAQEVADEYQEASDNWAGGNGHEEFQEKADACQSFADDCESWSASDETDEETVRAEAETVDEADEIWEHALETMRAEAIDTLSGFDL